MSNRRAPCQKGGALAFSVVESSAERCYDDSKGDDSVIGACIAKLRKERGITQETLAEVIGVSPQTISKWENQTTYPDVMLLPVLADFFGVTVDAFYGRDAAARSICAEDAVAIAMEQMRRVFVGCFYQTGQRESFEQMVEDHRQALKSGEARSVIETQNGGVIYMRDPTGSLIIKRPAEGWNSLFQDDDVRRMLLILADDDYRKAMSVILKKRMLTFTLPALCRMAAVEEREHLESLLKDCGLFTCKTLAIDESVLTYYELTGGEQKMYLLLAALLFVQDYVTYKSNHCYFMGNMNYFTP